MLYTYRELAVLCVLGMGLCIVPDRWSMINGKDARGDSGPWLSNHLSGRQISVRLFPRNSPTPRVLLTTDLQNESSLKQAL